MAEIYFNHKIVANDFNSNHINKKQKSESRNSEIEDGPAPEKPLKLVLNLKVGIGSSQESLADETSSPVSDEKRHKHKKKKKKKSAERERSRYEDGEVSRKRAHDEEESGDDVEVEPIEIQKKEFIATEPFSDQDIEESDGNSSPSRKLREPRTCTVKDNDGAILKQMLNYLLKTLQNKDVNGFFAFPVTDAIAPGYSTIIRNPMDFSTMASKIEIFEYCNVMEFKSDFALMCNNAMIYNRPDTIYFKEAKRLSHLGIRQLSKEKLLLLKKTQSFLASITLQELGFDESGHVMEPAVAIVQEEAKERFAEDTRVEEEIRKSDLVPQEEIAPEEILAQAQNAAEKARDVLSTRKPKTDLGFLRLDENGTTTMTIMNPCNDGVVSSKQRVISLGDYMGKLTSGSGSLFKYREDKRNKVDTETYLCYGPFSSHAPTYDSSFATCTKEESDLLLGTYGGEIGVQYAKSVQKFVENAGSSAVEMVDKLLDTLTGGQHSKTREIQRRRDEETAQKVIQEEMITKAQQAAEEAEAEAASDKMQQSLNKTAVLLSELSQTQNERLSQRPPGHLSAIAQPSNKEADLANQVTDSLVKMTKQVRPQNVVSTGAVRNAMGITTLPAKKMARLDTETTSENEVDAHKAEKSGNTISTDEDSDDDSEMESHEDSENEDGLEATVGESMDDTSDGEL